ncbi:hypothetical protein K491DRAFT_715823 [Lophiostoma macrostomum CBS 122681]|uniref:Uncharacterized protein n=1 Tax=Lophiostoma macrostomum CBS 122681 TaxID=1314788 RepID=A0A6A6T865_9PLEO|nr:hypothetical protein K491DRAFT_715823 [Lophiostoma macrostomum CBS 122681]
MSSLFFNSGTTRVTPTPCFYNHEGVYAQDRYSLTFFPEFKESSSESTEEHFEKQTPDVDVSEVMSLDYMPSLEEQEIAYALYKTDSSDIIIMPKSRKNTHSHTPRDTTFDDFVPDRNMPSMGYLDRVEESKQQNSTGARFKAFAKKVTKTIANAIMR